MSLFLMVLSALVSAGRAEPDFAQTGHTLSVDGREWKFIVQAPKDAPAAPCSGERELTPGERKIIEIFGQDTPRPIPLWPDKPPQALDNPPAEEITPEGRIRGVSTPTVSVYLPPPEKSTGAAIIMCPGGGYGLLDWVTHVVGSATCLVPEGIAVIGLKYRTCSPSPVSREIRDIALLDVQRAVRMVRSHAVEWNINPRRIGVAGYSAGADLTMHLAGNFDYGHADSPDPVERVSCRPDFVAGCSTWHWRESKSPFIFRRDTPPTFLVHATNDGVPGKDGRISGAPIQLPKEIKLQLEQLGVPVRMAIFEEGAHGVGNLIPTRYNHGFPGAQWPGLLIEWLDSLSSP